MILTVTKCSRTKKHAIQSDLLHSNTSCYVRYISSDAIVGSLDFQNINLVWHMLKLYIIIVNINLAVLIGVYLSL